MGILVYGLKKIARYVARTYQINVSRIPCKRSHNSVLDKIIKTKVVKRLKNKEYRKLLRNLQRFEQGFVHEMLQCVMLVIYLVHWNLFSLSFSTREKNVQYFR